MPLLAVPALPAQPPQDQNPAFRSQSAPSELPPDTAAVLLWRNAPLQRVGSTPPPTELEMRQNLRAYVVADPYLGEAYQWRQLVRGQAQRQWQLGASDDDREDGVRLSLGRQTLPVLQLAGVGGARAAVLLSGETFGFGTTRPLKALDQQLTGADQMLGEAPSTDASQFDWISVKPITTGRASLNFIYLRGRNDLNPGSAVKSEEQMQSGALTGATLTYALPMRWKLNGEWLKSNMEEAPATVTASNNGDNSAWVIALSGPVSHPWGETGVRFSRREIGAGFSSFSGAPTDAGAATTELSAEQPFKIGAWSGSVGLNWSEQTSEEATALTPAHTDTALQGTADARWQITPTIAVTGTHSSTSSTVLAPESVTNQVNSNSKAAMEWKMPKGVALSLGYGYYYQRAIQDETTTAETGTNRISLALKRKSRSTTLGMQLASDATADAEGYSSSARSAALSVDQSLAPWLKVGGSYRFRLNETPLDGTIPGSDLTARAALDWQDLGALELHYSQSGLSSDGVQLPAGVALQGYGIRYLWGARSGQAGLGFSVDYSCKNAWNARDDKMWRVGITYR